jgi:hypothetical protein
MEQGNAMSHSTQSKRWKQIAVSITALSLAALSAAPAHAGPFSAFEQSLAEAYAPYRAALLQTNQKDKAASEQSVNAFATRWSTLITTYRTTPPPQYADDAKWAQTVTAIDGIIASAKTAIETGDLTKGHDVLEAVREKLGELRLRNGVITFSDRMDAYHEQMEHILKTKLAPGAEGMTALREEAAILVHILAIADRNAPVSMKANPAFTEGIAAVTATAKGLLTAARTGDQPAIEKALQALKPAYARFFVKFG